MSLLLVFCSVLDFSYFSTSTLQDNNQRDLSENWTLDYDLDSPNYEDLIGKIRSRNTRGSIDGIPLVVSSAHVGVKQYFYVRLCSGVVPEATLQFRKTDLYLLGFGTRTDSWFAFKEFVGEITTSNELKSKAFDLGYEGSYTDLERTGAVDHLKQCFGQENFNFAARTVGKHRKGSDDDARLRKALVILIFTISEAVRFRTLCSSVKGQFENGNASISSEIRELVNTWEKLSNALINAYREKEKGKGKQKNEANSSGDEPNLFNKKGKGKSQQKKEANSSDDDPGKGKGKGKRKSETSIVRLDKKLKKARRHLAVCKSD